MTAIGMAQVLFSVWKNYYHRLMHQFNIIKVYLGAETVTEATSLVNYTSLQGWAIELGTFPMQ